MVSRLSAAHGLRVGSCLAGYRAAQRLAGVARLSGRVADVCWYRHLPDRLTFASIVVAIGRVTITGLIARNAVRR